MKEGRSGNRAKTAAALVVMTALAATAGHGGVAEDAEAAYRAGAWAKAAAGYEKVVAGEGAPALAWYRLGVARHGLGQHEQALRAYEEAEAMQPAMQGLRYNMGCALAVLGRKEEALSALTQAIETTFVDPQAMKADSDLKSLQGDRRFEDLVAKAERKARPCEFDARAREFDFWVGDWDVFTPSGDRAGRNRITRTDHGCLILEEWTGARGGTGKSLNFYDTASGKWNQVWVDSSGGVLRYEGGLAPDGAMVMVGKWNRPGPNDMLRTTWSLLPDGRVRHASETTSDGGVTWEPRFELVYRKVEAAASSRSSE